MKYYPVNLDIRNRECLVVGGGRVGVRKVETLLKCGANVTVVSPVSTDRVQALSRQGKIKLDQRPFRTDDITDKFLVISATDDEKLNRQVYEDAEKQNTLCNIADRPEICNFILPAIIHRGDLVVTISTSGKSPAFAKKLRKDLEIEFGREYAEFLELMGAIRKKLLAEKHEPEAHKPIFEALISSGILDMIKNGDTNHVDDVLKAVLGDGYDYADLMKQK